MAFVTPVLFANNNLQNIICLRSDVPNSTSLGDESATFQLQDNQILINNGNNISNYPPINSLPCLDDLTNRNNDTSFIDNFGFLEEKDPADDTSIQLDKTLSQTQILFNCNSRVSSQPSKPDRDPLDFVISNFNLNDSNSIPTFPNGIETQDDVNLSPTFSSNSNFDVNLLLSLNEPEVTKKSQITNAVESNPSNVIIGRIVSKNGKHFDKSLMIDDLYKGNNVRIGLIPNVEELTCKKCKSSFDSFDNLLQHSVKHWKPREKCPIGGLPTCNKFCNKNYLKAHLRKDHLDSITDDFRSSISNVETQNDVGLLPNLSTNCNFDISNYSLISLSGIDNQNLQTVDRNVPLHNDISLSSIFPTGDDIGSINNSLNESNVQNVKEINTNLENEKNAANEATDAEKSPSKDVTSIDDTLTRCAGRPRNDGTSLYCIKKWKHCKHCDKKYLTINMMRKHIKIAHPKVYTNLKCSVCDKVFDGKEGLILHTADHWKPSGKCPIGGFPACGKFHSKPILRTHICRYHIKGVSGEKPHPCSKCFSSFDKPSQLKRHIRVHTKEKPFVCTECNLRFTQSNSLLVHKLTHSNQKPHKCPCCPVAFTQSHNRTIHLFNVHFKLHKSKGSVQCEKCSITLPNPKTAFKHYWKLHRDLAMSYLTENLNTSERYDSNKKQRTMTLKYLSEKGFQTNYSTEDSAATKTSNKKQRPNILKNSNPSLKEHKKRNKNIQSTSKRKSASAPVMDSTNLKDTEKLLQEFENATNNLQEPSIQNKTDNNLVHPVNSEINAILSEIGVTLENTPQITTNPIGNLSLPINVINYPMQDTNLQNLLEINQINGELSNNMQIPFNVIGNYTNLNQCLYLTLNNGQPLNEAVLNILPNVNDVPIPITVNFNPNPDTNNTSIIKPVNVNQQFNSHPIHVDINVNDVGPQNILNNSSLVNVGQDINNYDMAEISLIESNSNSANNLKLNHQSSTTNQSKSDQTMSDLAQILKLSPENYKIAELLGITKIKHIGDVNENRNDFKIFLSNAKKTELKTKYSKTVMKAFKFPKLANQCNICPASFKKLSDLKKHFNVHNKQ